MPDGTVVPGAHRATVGGMVSMMERLRDAMNAHDAERMASLFADTYESVQPVHPARGFVGRAQVLTNWSAVFAGVPDFTAELVAAVSDGETEWGEWDWRGRHTDGSPFLMRGVIILHAEEGLIRAARLYLEPADESGQGIDDSVRKLYRAPGAD